MLNESTSAELKTVLNHMSDETVAALRTDTGEGRDSSLANEFSTINQETKNEKILCPHCQRTATNGIKCKGICVADSDY